MLELTFLERVESMLADAFESLGAREGGFALVFGRVLGHVLEVLQLTRQLLRTGGRTNQSQNVSTRSERKGQFRSSRAAGAKRVCAAKQWRSARTDFAQLEKHGERIKDQDCIRLT